MSSPLDERIKIVDNFLSKDEYKIVIDTVRSATWKTQVSDRKKSHNYFLMYDVTDVSFFNKTLCDKIQKKFQLSNRLKRVYFNGQWFSRDGDFHVDGSDKTVLIYISNHNISWGGFTHFFEPPNNEYIISPVTNRLVIFPGNIMHKAYSFSNQNCPMRISLAFKFV